MSVKRVLLYLLYAVLIFGALVADSAVFWKVKVWIGRTYQPVPGYFITSATHILVGLVLGLEHLVKEFHKPGKWSVQKTRLIVIGIPSAVFSMYLAFAFWLGFRILLPMFILSSNLLFYFSGIIFGYIVASSFYKKPMRSTIVSDETLNI